MCVNILKKMRKKLDSLLYRRVFRDPFLLHQHHTKSMTNKMIMITTAPAGIIASNSSITSSSSSSIAVLLAEGVVVALSNTEVAITVSVGTTVGVAVVPGTSCVDTLVVPTQTKHTS